MVKLMLQPYNLLVLDEPTNHLDMRSKDILKNALLSFKGTAIIVSHDRDFLSGLVSKVYEFRDGAVKEHIGGIYEFLERRKLENLKELETKKAEAKSEASAENISEGKKQWLNKKEQEKIRRKVASQIAKIEKEIEQIELQIAQKDAILSNPDEVEATIDRNFYNEYEELKQKLSNTMHKWEQLHYEMEILQEE